MGSTPKVLTSKFFHTQHISAVAVVILSRSIAFSFTFSPRLNPASWLIYSSKGGWCCCCRCCWYLEYSVTLKKCWKCVCCRGSAHQTRWSAAEGDTPSPIRSAAQRPHHLDFSECLGIFFLHAALVAQLYFLVLNSQYLPEIRPQIFSARTAHSLHQIWRTILVLHATKYV